MRGVYVYKSSKYCILNYVLIFLPAVYENESQECIVCGMYAANKKVTFLPRCYCIFVCAVLA